MLFANDFISLRGDMPCVAGHKGLEVGDSQLEHFAQRDGMNRCGWVFLVKHLLKHIEVAGNFVRRFVKAGARNTRKDNDVGHGVVSGSPRYGLGNHGHRCSGITDSFNGPGCEIRIGIADEQNFGRTGSQRGIYGSHIGVEQDKEDSEE